MNDRFFTAWFIIYALLAVGWIAFLVWAGYQLVTWVTAL